MASWLILAGARMRPRSGRRRGVSRPSRRRSTSFVVGASFWARRVHPTPAHELGCASRAGDGALVSPRYVERREARPRLDHLELSSKRRWGSRRDHPQRWSSTAKVCQPPRTRPYMPVSCALFTRPSACERRRACVRLHGCDASRDGANICTGAKARWALPSTHDCALGHLTREPRARGC
ncbi:MAG: hypothetical protein BGO98_47085 [Myxococcales bacterium 68-20]|nr:MAG: hypothetical protein BGO98_47085 [Myxococcales bacterium 68-20]